ncbi:MAG TPA: EscU/YscU/HrcU family type III secretion system export apparatus switch protein [Burkholderiales bacterium]
MSTEKEDAKPKQVVGLKYEIGEGLPRVILKGSGRIAEEILLRRSLINGPPVVENAELAQQLCRLPIDAEIGPELFHLVATVLAHVFAVEEKVKRRTHG